MLGLFLDQRFLAKLAAGTLPWAKWSFLFCFLTTIPFLVHAGFSGEKVPFDRIGELLPFGCLGLIFGPVVIAGAIWGNISLGGFGLRCGERGLESADVLSLLLLMTPTAFLSCYLGACVLLDRRAKTWEGCLFSIVPTVPWLIAQEVAWSHAARTLSC